MATQYLQRARNQNHPNGLFMYLFMLFLKIFLMYLFILAQVHKAFLCCSFIFFFMTDLQRVFIHVYMALALQFVI